MSICRNHYQRTVAAQAAAVSADGGINPNSTEYDLMQMRLVEDKRKLKDIQSIERKVDVKRMLLPDYMPWVEGVLMGGAGAQDDVVITMMVWCIDVGDYKTALAICAYALEHDLKLPDQYQRTLGTLVAEEIADQALAADQFDIEVLLRTEDLVHDQDMPDEVRAKLHKAIGIANRKLAGEAPKQNVTFLQKALDYFRRALQLHDRVGVKKEIEQVEREIKNAGNAS